MDSILTSPSLQVVGLGGTLRPASISLQALGIALEAAEAAGASTTLLSLRELGLPHFEPGRAMEAYGAGAVCFLQAVRKADVLLLSTGTYHGTLTGVMKNALDFLELLAGDDPPYLEGKIVGLVATSGGDSDGVQALNAMTHVALALRATIVPQQVFIPRASTAIDDANLLKEPWPGRLRTLGHTAVRFGERMRPSREHAILCPV